MKVSGIINYNTSDKQYVDLNVYISPDDVCEYGFVVTLDRESGVIYDGGVTYAKNRTATFEEHTNPPADVKAAFDAFRPTMVAQLEVERAKGLVVV